MTTDSIASIAVRKVVVPFRIPPVTASGNLDNFCAVLIDLQTREGVVGRSYIWSFAEMFLSPLAEITQAVGSVIINESLAPADLARTLHNKFKLIDTPGLLGLALSGLDMAAWDAHAISLGRPLAQVLGAGTASIQAYNSCGLWIQDCESLADQVESLTEKHGFTAVKLRLGREQEKHDLEAIAAVRSRLDADHHLMVDYNQSLTVSEASRRLREIDNHGLYWVEEPIPHADFEGLARISRASTTPIQAGENLCDTGAMQRAITARAADFYMPDLQRIGGVSGWLQACALASANDLLISSHLFPEFSVHVLAASPTRHWLEYVDWADVLLQNPLQVRDGFAMVPDRPGAGIEWNEDAVAEYQRQ